MDILYILYPVTNLLIILMAKNPIYDTISDKRFIFFKSVCPEQRSYSPLQSSLLYTKTGNSSASGGARLFTNLSVAQPDNGLKHSSLLALPKYNSKMDPEQVKDKRVYSESLDIGISSIL